MNALPKQIKVVKSTGELYWYKNHIGEVFDVTGYCGTDSYFVRHDGCEKSCFVGMQDCEEVVAEEPKEQPKPIDAHYTSFVYTLTEQDKQAGIVKVDPYFVSNQWQLGAKDNTGILFHCLKNIARFSDKNTKEREIIALFKQVKRLAELEKVNLEGQ